MIKGHSKQEDFFAFIIAITLLSLGVYLIETAGLVTGGVAGLALFLSRLLGLSFGEIFFLLNLPFYILGYFRIGPAFALKAFLTISFVSLSVDFLPVVFEITTVRPEYVTLSGGLLIGVGMLSLFRHNMSIGGVNILAYYFQEKHNISAGKVQVSIDILVIGLSTFVMEWDDVILSVLAVILTNLVLIVNHIPGRYDPKQEKRSALS